jgi:hypothetical protein
MSRRLPPPPSTSRDPQRFEVATGGHPVERVVATLAPLVRRGTLQHVGIGHDDRCPCLSGASLAGCTCELVVVEVAA